PALHDALPILTLSHFHSPSFHLTSECSESGSCEEILEFWCRVWHAGACDLVSSKSRQHDPMPLQLHVCCIPFEKCRGFFVGDRSRSEAGSVEFKLKRFLAAQIFKGSKIQMAPSTPPFFF